MDKEETIWKQAKAMATRCGCDNDWTVVMHYFRYFGGTRRNVKAMINDKAYIIICMTDDGRPLCVSDTYEPIILDYDDVLTSKKIFYINLDKLTKLTVKLPDGATVSGEDTIDIFI